MPQMAPISWLTLFFTMSMMMIMLSTLNYFSIMQTPKKDKIKISIKKNWKW